MDKDSPLFKMNEATYMTLEEILSYLNDGRVFLAREKLEYILGVDPQKEKA